MARPNPIKTAANISQVGNIVNLYKGQGIRLSKMIVYRATFLYSIDRGSGLLCIRFGCGHIILLLYFKGRWAKPLFQILQSFLMSLILIRQFLLYRTMLKQWLGFLAVLLVVSFSKDPLFTTFIKFKYRVYFTTIYQMMATHASITIPNMGKVVFVRCVSGLCLCNVWFILFMLPVQSAFKKQLQESQQRVNSNIKEKHMQDQCEIHSQPSEKTQPQTTGEMLDKMDDRLMVVSVRRLSNHTVELSTDINQFKQYGPAVFLLFAFLKKIMILFSVLAVLSLILIFYNFAAGETFPLKASGVGIAFARASLGSFSASSEGQERTKLLYEIMISINLIACFWFLLYWKSYMAKEASLMEAELQLSNHKTIILEGKGIEGTTQKDIQDFMLQFGVVKEIVRVVNRGEEIMIASQICQLEKEIRAISQKGDTSQKKLKNVQKKYDNIEVLRQQLKEQISKNQAHPNLRYIIQMDTVVSTRNITKILKDTGCCQKQDQKYKIMGQPVHAVPCQAQSWGVYWQNQHVGIKQQLIPNIILFLLTNMVALSTILVFGLISVIAEPVYYNPSLSTNNSPEADMLHQKNATTLASWCIGNHYSPAMEATCSPFMDQLYSRGGIYLAIACYLVLSRFLMKFTIINFAKNLRFKDHAEFSHGVTMHLFINYTIVSVVIALSVQSNLFGSAMSDVIANFVTIEPAHNRLKGLRQYFDYVPEWYADYGFQLALNYIILIILPYAALPLIHFVSQKIKLIFKKPHSGQQKMEKSEDFYEFELEDHYASCLSAIVVGMAFAGGMPIMFPLILAALLVRYFSIKYLFIYVNKPTKITDRLIASKTSVILMVAFFAYTMNSVWALGVQQIFTSKTHLFESMGINSTSNAKTIPQAFLVLFRRIVNTWPIVFVLILCFIMVGFRKKLLHTWLKLLRTLRIRINSNNSMEMNQMELHEHQNRERSYDPLNHQYYRQVFQKLKTR